MVCEIFLLYHSSMLVVVLFHRLVLHVNYVSQGCSSEINLAYVEWCRPTAVCLSIILWTEYVPMLANFSAETVSITRICLLVC